MAMSEVRVKWRAVKDKYKADLAGVTFSSQLGPTLDEVVKLMGTKHKDNQAALAAAKKEVELTKKIHKTCGDYIAVIKQKVSDKTSQGALVKVLTEIQRDCD